MAQEPAQTAGASNASATAKTILAMDYGRARIGLAIGDEQTSLARPLGTLVRVNRNEDMRRLRELIREHAVRQVVVGLPLRLDGTRGEMAEEAARFARRVGKQLGVAVEMVDERLTSWEAERLMEERSGRVLRAQHGIHKKRAGDKGVSVDSLAATVILQEYLARRDVTKAPSSHI